MEFTRQEISEIEKNLGFIVFDWAKHLINHIVSQARNKGVEVVYINTPESLDAGAITDAKTEYFYEKLPPLLGFRKDNVNLRRREESLWAYYLNPKQASFLSWIKTANSIPINQIPSAYHGAFINIIGRKPEYTQDEVKRVLQTLEKKQKKPKALPKFYYDWDSKTWTGSQRFLDSITENVVLQKIPSEIQDKIQNSPALLKFWSFILSQSQHFDPDTIGFALVSKVSSKAWVINEIQTDVINAYMKLRRIDKDVERKQQSMTWETLRDMLVAQNRSKWVSKVESNEAMKNQLLNNPNMIAQLPDDTHDIDKWLEEQMAQMGDNAPTMGLDLIRHFNSINFNSKIYRLY